MSDEKFYLKFVAGSFLGCMAQKARKDIYNIFMEQTRPSETSLILDVGVSVVEGNPKESNILEQCYPYLSNITMLGIHDGGFLEKYYPGAKYVRYDPENLFPFADDRFDICYCNAVIEHVGEEEDRKRFLKEILRVGKTAFIATPNRWYPVEFHKMIPFLHWLPQNWYRYLLSLVGENFYCHKKNLNLLSKSQLEKLLSEVDVPYQIIPYRFIGLVSNFIVVAKQLQGHI